MGRDFVVAKFGYVYVVSVYVSPNEGLNYFLDFLDELRDYYLSIRGSFMLICGDFNARSSFWGDSVCNKRGEAFEEWAAGLDFRLCNEGARFTCVRPQGSSIVDTTWILSNGVGRLDSWSVVDNMETLSDHKYISSTLVFGSTGVVEIENLERYPRWSWSNFDKALFRAALEFKLSATQREMTAEEFATWVAEQMEEACDLAAQRFRSRP